MHERVLALPIVMRTIQLCLWCCFIFEIHSAANHGHTLHGKDERVVYIAEDIAVDKLLDHYVHLLLWSKGIDDASKSKSYGLDGGVLKRCH